MSTVVTVWHAGLDDDPAGPVTPADAAELAGVRDATAHRRRLAARGVLRAVLAAETGLAPEALALTHTAAGRPRLDGPVRFSLSHAGAHALVAVTRDREVGADLEALDPALDPVALGRHVLTAVERDHLAQLPAGDRIAGFLGLWTAKEAWLKALGTGFALDARRLHVGMTPTVATLEGHGPFRLEPVPAPDGHVATIALAGDGPCTLVARGLSA